MPKTLVGRTEQLADVDKLLDSEYSNENLWIEGGTGLGKTTTLKFFIAKVNHNGTGRAFYIPCEKSMKNSIDRVRISARLPLAKRDISSTGFAQAVMKAFPNQRYFFVIDEPDKVYAKRDISNFIHCLWNLLIDGGCKFNFIFISKYSITRMMSKVFPSEADDTFSRLQPKSIIFPVYTVPEIVAILQQRLDLQNVRYDLAGLTIIGRHIRRIGGDMRQALEVTREAVRLAHLSSNILDIPTAEKAIEWGKNIWWERRLKSIPPHWAFIVYVAAQYCYEKGLKELEEPAVTRLYKTTCETLSKKLEEKGEFNKKIDPVGNSTIYWMIKQVSGANENVTPFFEQRLAKYGLPAEIVFDESDRNRIATVGRTFNWADYLAVPKGGC